MMANLHPSDPEVQIPPTATQTQVIPADPIATAASDISIDPLGIYALDELRVRAARERVRVYGLNLAPKIHRFPASLRGFFEERQYIAPKMVAIGPYHRHLPELQEMEMVKKWAPQYFCKDDVSLEACQMRVVAAARTARSCYEAESLEGVSDTDFASMMFHDACFLLATIRAITVPAEAHVLLVLCRASANTPVVVTDMFLLENQIPWVVLQALMTKMGMNVQCRIDRQAWPLDLRHYEPPHILGLFRFYQSGNNELASTAERTQQLEVCSESSAASTNHVPKHVLRSGEGPYYIFSAMKKSQRQRASVLEKLPLGTSAIELAEIGIKLTLSKTAEFKDIGFTGGFLSRKIFLPSLRLNENTACWLVNMAAFEVCTAVHDRDYPVSSYLALFAMFMHREEDVHELRAKRLINGEFTNKQTLEFFKGRHAGNLQPGYDFYAILRRLERYKQRCGLWISIHKFVYKNVKTIVAVLSIVGVLVGIFKTLLSLKQH